MISAVELAADQRAAVRAMIERRILERRLAAGMHPSLAARAAERIYANTTDDESARTQAWALRDLMTDLGTAWTHARDRRAYLADLDVPVEHAHEALVAIMAELAGQELELLALDLPAGDEVAAAAIASTQAELQSTQMQLDLATPVENPLRVELRPMTATEFAAYRATAVEAYAQDLFDSGAFLDLESALESAATQTAHLLPAGRDSPGHHLWTAYDGHVPVGILWIFAGGDAAFIYDIEVRTDQRRLGYGREILDAGALAARRLGAEAVGLNVFGHNDGARALYETAGYATTEQSYRIDLA